MQTSARLRDQIEEDLNARFAGALSPRMRSQPPRTPCGIAALDDLLDGGLPTGVLTELVGAPGSGRTTAALAYVAAVAQAGGVCAWIDVADALDLESAAACGVDLERLLWVRCGLGQQAPLPPPPQVFHRAPGTMSSSPALARHTGGGSPHPRSEGKDMPQAVSALMTAHGGLYDQNVRREKRSIGTPGAPNRPLAYRSEHREEQVNLDRLPARRGDNLALEPRCAEPQWRHACSVPASAGVLAAASNVYSTAASSRKPWPVLDQALRVADLLLQGGGFSAIVLDLGSTAPEAAWRIPLATWFRFRAACERTRASLVLLTQHPCARSSAELVVRLQAGVMEAEGGVMTGIRHESVMQRSRRHENAAQVVPIRKPPQSATADVWRSEAAWAQAK